MPPILGNVDGLLGAIGAGTATNWPGGGYDPELHIVFAPAGNTPSARSIVAPPKGFSDIKYVSGMAGQPFREGPWTWRLLRRRFAAHRRARARGPGATSASRSAERRRRQPRRQGLTVQGLPIVKPPYGLLAAINLDRGERAVADAARRHAGQHPQSSRAARHEHPEDRAGQYVRRRPARDQDAW